MVPDSPIAAGSAASAAALLRLVRDGAANSRAELARMAGISPSTAATRVEELLRLGLLRDVGAGRSRGGRRPQHLEYMPAPGVVGVADLGASHASLAVFDLLGTLVAEREDPIAIADGPDAVLQIVLGRLRELAGDAALRGIALSLPGPVDATQRRMVSPSRMPGWNGVDVAARMSELAGVPALADNDANLMAVGEAAAAPGIEHLVFVKAGSGIGCGVIADGRLHRGAHGMAGDISHVSVPDAGHVLCSCGRYDCLDAVASGAAIVGALRDAGLVVEDMTTVLRLANDADPLVTRMLREAGTRTGNVLATIVNFFNPAVLALGGHLSQAEAFVAGVRSAIYTQCLPMATDHLEIVVTRAGRLGGAHGAARRILDELFEQDMAALGASAT